MSTIAQQENLVKESLFQFITKKIPSADLNVIDDIVLSYVISILEEASQDPCFDVEGVFEIDEIDKNGPHAQSFAVKLMFISMFLENKIGFIEMMAAYVPEFSGIDAGAVCSWVLELEAELSQGKGSDQPDSSNDESSIEDKLSITLQTFTEMVVSGRPRHVSISNVEEVEDPKSPLLEGEEFGPQCRVLAEMFPNTAAMEIKHCVTIADGDVERAAATLLHRREQGQSLSPAALHNVVKQPLCNDSELKNRIIARYSYVDKNSGQKEHKPLAPKFEPKKLVRYRDNKIVSLKGERYTEVPKSGIDEEHLKKPKKQHCP